MEQKNKEPLGKGSILFHSQFEFTNGELGEKLLIILNDPDPSSEEYLICRVTSQRKDKPDKFGCHPEQSLFFLPAGRDFFKDDTWIQLYEIFPIVATSLLKDHFDGELRLMGKLQELTIKQLMNCIKMIRDIDLRYKEMILHC